MTGSAAGGRARARWPAVCVLLLGLFLMHGAPASAGTGCHGTLPRPLSATMPGPQAHSGSVPAPRGATGQRETSAAISAATARSEPATSEPGASEPGSPESGEAAPRMSAPGMSGTGAGGAVCRATPARGSQPLLAPPALLAAFLVADLALLAWVSRMTGPAGAGLRAPPGGGRGLLLQVCVART